MTDCTRFSCPNPSCSLFKQIEQGNIAHRSWTGVRKDIRRLRCTACKMEFSSRRGTLLEYAKISDHQQVKILKCMKWCVCEEGIADICCVTRATVRLFQTKAANRAKCHHNNQVHSVSEEGAQCDELYAKLAGKKAWLGAAIGMQSLMIFAIVIGARQQGMADELAVNLWARCTALRMLLTDGWAPYFSAFLRCFGKVYQPRRRGCKGKRKSKRIRLLSSIFYGQVIKRAKKVNNRWRLKQVVIRAMNSRLEQCKRFIRAYKLGNTIHTIHIERWFGSLRNSVGCLRRRSRCPVALVARLEEKAWVFASLYNWVLPHESLSKGKVKRTPAMAAGLIDHPLTYQEYVYLPVHKDEHMARKIEQKLSEIQSEEMKKAAKRSSRAPPEEEVLWQEGAA
jgi:transposase-like protein